MCLYNERGPHTLPRGSPHPPLEGSEDVYVHVLISLLLRKYLESQGDIVLYVSNVHEVMVRRYGLLCKDWGMHYQRLTNSLLTHSKTRKVLYVGVSPSSPIRRHH